MTIYNPYTYLIGWSKLNKWYYGVRFAKKCHPSDLWVKYFTSSKQVKEYRAKFGEPDIIKVRKLFVNAEAAICWEEKVLRRLNVLTNEIWLNQNISGAIRSNTHKTYIRTPKIREKQKIKKIGKFIAKNCKTQEIIGLVDINDPRRLTGEIVGVNKNKSTKLKGQISKIKGHKKSKIHNEKNQKAQNKKIEDGTHPTQIHWFCKTCNKGGMGLSNFSRYHKICESVKVNIN
jgi:hypothetical protein